MKTFLHKALPILGVVLWVVLAGFGFARLAQYESRAGAQVPPPEAWPADSRLPRSADRATLVMFVHPQCPCSRASLEELSAVARQADIPPQVLVVFYRPAGFAEGWEQTELWEQARAIPEVVTVCDADEVERERFGVLTSGQTLLYDADGLLRFRGGLTRARGIAGQSASREQLLSALAGDASGIERPVFGCPLVSGDDPPRSVSPCPQP